MNIHKGGLSAVGGRYALVASRFNELVVDSLVKGAQDSLVRHDVPEDQIDLFWVPGAMEVPVVCSRAAKSGRYDAVIALGAVIRGATPHFDVVVNAVAGGCAHISLETDVPVIFGVLTTDSIEQALERAGTKAGNQGRHAAVTALEMVSVLRTLED
ncbi:MAG: 6,7-dimethyl-8-ribityllumazine synthase [Myxococcota bacterium]